MSGILGAETNAARLAQEWRDRVAKIARNLTDFNDSEACVRVKARMEDPDRRYRGKTEAAAKEAIVALDALWQDYLMLSRVVDEAAALAKRSGILVNHDDEVVAMLTGASIKLPAVSIPVQNRGLLDTPESQGKVAPADVLNSMVKAFDVARTTVSQIDEAENRIGARVAALKATVDETKAWAAAQGLEAIDLPAPALDDVDGDPLGALDRLTKAEAEVAALVARRDEVRAQLAAFDQALARARDDLAALRADIEKAKQARDEAGKRFEGAALAVDPRLDGAAGELATWLKSLATPKTRARPKAALIGLSKWEEARAARTTAAREPIEGLRRLVAEQDDISGRLRALRAKGASLAAAGASPSALSMLEEQAKVEVRRTPFRAAQAKALVRAYEDALAKFARTK